MTLRKPELLSAIAVCIAAGAVGSIFTAPAIDNWYQTLQKPFFSPPNWLFAPVWTVLYILMGISLYLVWQKRSTKIGKYALKLFFVQLILNTAWSVVFFGLRNPSLAFAEILVLWTAIVLTMKAVKPISKKAFYLLLPYLVWVSFASALNLSIVLLN